MEILYFSLAQRKVLKETYLFARLVPKKPSPINSQFYSTYPVPFAILKLRDDAHPSAEALKYQPLLAAKRPEKDCSFAPLFNKVAQNINIRVNNNSSYYYADQLTLLMAQSFHSV